LTDCTRPLDPLDCEALAAGDAPVFAADAASHAASCVSCGAAVACARSFLLEIEGDLSPAVSSPSPDLAARVIRIRPFSRRERRDWRLWTWPAAFSAAILAVGTGILAAPGLSVRDQAGLSLALLAPLAGLARAAGRFVAEAFSASPDGWRALSDAAGRSSTLGFAALLLLAPAGFALRRVLARSPRRS